MISNEEYDAHIKERNREDYIKVGDLEPGWLYYIHARNAHYGIWNPNSFSFVIRRKKFNCIYTFDEIHWDMSKSFGTAKPFKKLELSPFSQEDLRARTIKGEKNDYWGKPLESDILEYLKTKGVYWDQLLADASLYFVEREDLEPR